VNKQRQEKPIDELLTLISRFLYGTARERTTMSFADIRGQFPNLNAAQVDDTLQRLSRRELIQVSLGEQLVQLVPEGKLANEFAAIPELVLGEQYISDKYCSAVVHIIVQTPDGDERGGTGFFVDDFPGWLVTAWHVIGRGNQVLRIENSEGTILQCGECERHGGSEDLDLTLLRCPKQDCVIPLRIEWREDVTRRLDKVLIFGYPPFARHRVDQFVASGKIGSKPWRLGQQRQSLIVSGNVRGGCSGGPVVSEAGLVVGVIAEDDILQREAGPTEYVAATPSASSVESVNEFRLW
jgi:S1-C subfamily serine protease